MVARPPSPARRWHRPATLLALAAGGLWSLHALVRGLENRAPLSVLWGAWAWVLLTALALSSALCAGAAVRVWRRAPVSTAWLRDVFCILVAGAALYVALAQPFAQLTADFALGLCAGLFGLRVLLGTRRAPRAVELLAFNLCLALVLGEVGLRMIATVMRSPLLVTSTAGVVEQLESHRYEPGHVRWGFPCNSGGHYDDEFEPRADRTGETIAMIGDLFSTGTVPHDYHFTTVCEHLLDGVQVYNVGIAAIDPPAYLYLLETEVLPLEPDLIVVDLFVGNDFVYRPFGGSGWARRWLDRDNVLLCLLPKRLATIDRERRALGDAGADVGRPQGEDMAVPLINDIDELKRRFPWVVDPAFEEPTFSAEAFRGIETRRAQRVCRTTSDYGPCIDVIGEMQKLAADIPFAVVLIPDEFQVEDGLWQTITAGLGTRLDRDRPQRVVGEALRSLGIPYLDLLPVLRRTPPMPDGNRHLYHLRDTHFNARGNRVAGEAIAEFVPSLLE